MSIQHTFVISLSNLEYVIKKRKNVSQCWMVKVFYLINKKKDIESEIFENFQYREEINYRATKFSSYVHRLVLRLFAYTDKNRKGKT